MESMKASLGMRVRVGEPAVRPEFWGMAGIIKGMWGHPEHPALDVLLDDGRSQLFWYHELEAFDGEARPRVGALEIVDEHAS